MSSTLPKRYLTGRQLSDRYQVSPRTIEDWRRRGVGPPYLRLNGRDVLYPEDGVAAWEAERTFAHRAAELDRGAARRAASKITTGTNEMGTAA